MEREEKVRKLFELNHMCKYCEDWKEGCRSECHQLINELVSDIENPCENCDVEDCEPCGATAFSPCPINALINSPVDPGDYRLCILIGCKNFMCPLFPKNK